MKHIASWLWFFCFFLQSNIRVEAYACTFFSAFVAYVICNLDGIESHAHTYHISNAIKCQCVFKLKFFSNTLPLLHLPSSIQIESTERTCQLSWADWSCWWCLLFFFCRFLRNSFAFVWLDALMAKRVIAAANVHASDWKIVCKRVWLSAGTKCKK